MGEVPLYSPLLRLGIELGSLQKGSEASPSAPNWTSTPVCLPDPVPQGSSLIRNNSFLGPYSRTISRAVWWPYGGGVFLTSEVSLHPRDGESLLPLLRPGVELV